MGIIDIRYLAEAIKEELDPEESGRLKEELKEKVHSIELDAFYNPKADLGLLHAARKALEVL